VSIQTAKSVSEAGMGPRETPAQSPREISPRMFENPILEWGSRVHPIVPPLLYLPVIGYLLIRAVGHEQLSGAAVAGVFALGVVAWSLSEYLLHRFVFHLEPDSRWGRRLHFIIHGVHHDFPHDPMRLVMPPSVSIPLAIGFWFLFRAVLGPEWALPAFAGFLLGYLVYDMSHYHMHHHRSKNRLSLAVRRYHYRHHFQQSDRGYGVTTPLWDRIFRTSPVVRRRSS
jgi:sterol desaturase/sphingolipid hydroxylase (fatty acid hydroxylase superfamily)